MIIITGAAGFIGSVLLKKLNNEKINNIVIVDDFTKIEKKINFENKSFIEKVDRSLFEEYLNNNYKNIEYVIHIGARTDTTEFDVEIFNKLNLNYSKMIWNQCSKYSIPLIYASSAATYGMGENGYSDDHSIIPQLKPLNPYGESKNNFDIWALNQKEKPPFWAGLKFFNVFGPNEYHKNRMASVIFHAEKQIKETQKVKLFRSHNSKFEDGKQLRDFIYVKDVVSVIYWLMIHKKDSGIYNLGTGKARSFYDLAIATFKSIGKEPKIEFINTPEDIREKYQYFTQADMSKLINIGYNKPFSTLEEGIDDYLKNYLLEKKYF